jgi:hypothetical protein
VYNILSEYIGCGVCWAHMRNSLLCDWAWCDLVVGAVGGC